MKLSIPSLAFSSDLNPLQPPGRSTAGAIQIDSCAVNKRLNLSLEANARVKVLAGRVASEGGLLQVLCLFTARTKALFVRYFSQTKQHCRERPKLIPCEHFGSCSAVLS